jgi:very-short-patch-repair endonuclease
MHTPNWNQIRDHYQALTPRILAERKDEWAADPYEWSHIIQLTPIEDWLWVQIRDANAIFYPQYPVGRYFVDFANPKARVAVECDGAAYHLDKAKDAARDRALREMGWVVYRIPGYDCVRDNDHETGRIREAARFLYRVVLDHGLSRNQSMNEMMRAALDQDQQPVEERFE